MDEALLLVIQQIQAMSPVAWEILVKQAYNEAIEKVVWGLLFGLVAFAVFKFVQKQKADFDEEHEDWSEETTYVVDSEYGGWLYLLTAVLTIISANFLISAVMWFANPQFYAIRFLLDYIN